jgi:hypothetical protein
MRIWAVGHGGRRTAIRFRWRRRDPCVSYSVATRHHHPRCRRHGRLRCPLTPGRRRAGPLPAVLLTVNPWISPTLGATGSRSTSACSLASTSRAYLDLDSSRPAERDPCAMVSKPRLARPHGSCRERGGELGRHVPDAATATRARQLAPRTRHGESLARMLGASLALVALLAGCGGGERAKRFTATAPRAPSPPPVASSPPTTTNNPGRASAGASWSYAKLVASLAGRTLVLPGGRVLLDGSLLVFQRARRIGRGRERPPLGSLHLHADALPGRR